MFRMKADECPIAFIAFRDEIFAEQIPVRVCSKNGNLGTDVMRWMQTAFAQNVRGHCWGGGLSVHSRDKNATLSLHDSGEGLSAAHDRFARIAGADQDWIVVLNRGRKDNQISIAGSGRAMLPMKT